MGVAVIVVTISGSVSSAQVEKQENMARQNALNHQMAASTSGGAARGNAFFISLFPLTATMDTINASTSLTANEKAYCANLASSIITLRDDVATNIAIGNVHEINGYNALSIGDSSADATCAMQATVEAIWNTSALHYSDADADYSVADADCTSAYSDIMELVMHLVMW